MSEKEHNQSATLLGIHLGEIRYLPDDVREGLEERKQTLINFASNPDSTALWDYVTKKALEEEKEGLGQPQQLTDISASALIEFARSIYSAKPEDRYGLTTAEAPNGKLWFDVLYGFHSPSGNVAIANAIDRQIESRGINKVGIAVDLGTGTGETASIIATKAEHTIGLDRNRQLLDIARERHPSIEFIEGDVTSLPFEDNSVDIITSDGLKYSLSKAGSERMYIEIARVLKEGGVYIDTDWMPAKKIILNVHPSGGIKTSDYNPEELLTFVTWRSVLQDMIVDTVSGKYDKPDSLELSGHGWQAFKAQHGLYEETYQLKSDFISYLSRARMLYKDPVKTAVTVSQHRAFIRGLID